MPRDVQFPYKYEWVASKDDDLAEELALESRFMEPRRIWCRRWRWKTVALYSPLAAVFFFGIVHLINVSASLLNPLLDSPTNPFPPSWSPLLNLRPGQTPDITSLTRDVRPIACHSHNDYWRRIPLYEALQWGCTGVEADVWLFDNELFVGHNTYALTRSKTFASMYVEPLLRIVDQRNAGEPGFVTAGGSEVKTKAGVFEVDSSQTLVLLVDFKNDGHAIFPFVHKQLTPLREKGYLTYYDGNTTVPGPITVVATGNAPFDLITADESYRDIFFDAPLDRMYQDPSSPSTSSPASTGPSSSTIPAPHSIRASGQGTVGISSTSHFNPGNSYYASVDFKKAVGWAWFGRLSTHQINLIRGQIRGAHAAGLKARYWGTPGWPVGVRNMVWRVLVEEGVDYLNGDDLAGMTKVEWGVRRHWGAFGR